MSRLHKGFDELKRRTQALKKTEGASVPAGPPASAPAGPPATASVPTGPQGWVPAGPPGWTPAGSPGWSPAGSPGWTPAGSPGWAHAGPPGWAPAGPPGWTPAGSPGWTPAGPPGWTPAGSQGWAPAGPPTAVAADPSAATPADPPAATPAGPPAAAPDDPPAAVPADPPTAVPADPPTTVPTDPPAAVPADPPAAVPNGPPTTAPAGPPAAVPAGPPATVPAGPPAAVPAGPPAAVPAGPPAAVPAGPPAAVPAGPPAAVPAGPPAAVPTGPPGWMHAGPHGWVPTGPSGWVPTGASGWVPTGPSAAAPASPPASIPSSPPASVLSDQDEQQGQEDPNMEELKKDLRNLFQELNHPKPEKPEKRKPPQEWKNGVLRLLDTNTIKLAAPKSDRSLPKSDQPTQNWDQTPEYAILSHRWSEDEVLYKDIQGPHEEVKEKQGYGKIERFCRKAKKNNIRYAWVDTCCIDKDSSAELSQSINSMFEWYKDAKECYVYLADVSDQSDSDLQKELKGFESKKEKLELEKETLEKERLRQNKEKDELDKETDDELDKETDEELDKETDEDLDQERDEELDQGRDEELDQGRDEGLDKEKEELDKERDEELDKLEKKLESLKKEMELLKRLLKNRESSRLSGETLPKNYELDFEKSEWFTRGWTLQELIAPKRMTFYDRKWNPIGSKEEHCKLISKVTGINPEFLRLSQTPGGEDFECDIRKASVSARMSWAAGRVTTRQEDVAYSLLGIFGVSMPALYGEGGHQAFIRLQEEIIKKSDDQTILAWSQNSTEDLSQRFSGALASKPADFMNCGHFIPDELGDGWGPFTMTNQGLQIELPLIPLSGISNHQKVVGAILACRPRKSKELQNLQDPRGGGRGGGERKWQDLERLQWQELEELQQLLVIPLACEEGSPNQYVRLASLGCSCFVRAEASCLTRQKIYIKQFDPSLPGKAESSQTKAKCDGFLLRRQDPLVVGYRCKSIPEGSFDDITHAVRRPSTDQPSWEVKLHFKKKFKGLDGLIPTAFDVILGYSEKKGKYCKIDTLLNIPGVFPDSDRTFDSGGGVKVFLIEKPLRLASGDHFTIVDIEMEPGLMRKVSGIFGGIWQNVAEYSKTNQKDKFRRTVEKGEEKGGKILAPDEKNRQKRDKLLRIMSDGIRTVQPFGLSS